MWEYQAIITNVVDGDTLDCKIDLGFTISTKQRLRLARVDTHETYGVSHDTDEYKQGVEETEFVEGWLKERGFEVVVRTAKTGKFGRYIAEIEDANGECLNDTLLNEFDVGYD